MQDFSRNVFQYSGKRFTFTAELFVNQDGKEYSQPLLNENITLFEYQNEMNNLVLTGSLTYIDKYAHVDKYLNEQYLYARICLIQHKQEFDEDIVIDKLDDTSRFEHVFLVSSINIIARSGGQITYKLDLVNLNWFKCVSNIKFSNYSNEDLQIFSIIKAILKKGDLRINDEKYDNVTTKVNLKYITRSNDNVFSSVDYLLKMLYFYKDKDDSFKSLIYDEHKDMFQLFDIKNPATANGSYVTTLSFFKSNLETTLNVTPNDIRSVSKFHTTDGIQSSFDLDMNDYDYNTNKFIRRISDHQKNLKFMNSRFDNNDYVSKFKKMFDSNLTYQNSSSYWNNDLWTYDSIFKLFCEDNSIVLNTTGEILRKPGSYMTISIDRDDDMINSEDLQKLAEQQLKYKAFEGIWIIAKTRHLISLSDCFYRQNLVLMRNFQLNDEKVKSL